MKKCCYCKKVLSKSEFYKDKSMKDGFNSRCKKCKDYEDKIYRSKNKEKVLLRERKNVNLRKTSWEVIIPKISKCEICGETIFYNNRNQKKAIHFDHRHEGTEVITKPPIDWLKGRKYSKENEAIWKSCDFGMLCFQCNRRLPTMNRKDWLIKVNKYMYGKL